MEELQERALRGDREVVRQLREEISRTKDAFYLAIFAILLLGGALIALVMNFKVLEKISC